MLFCIYILDILFSLKVPPLQCLEDISKAGLGLENGRILNKQLTASSGDDTTPFARLNFQSTQNVTQGGWIASTTDSSQWLQIDLYRQTQVGGVVLQGRQDQDEWVTRYKVEVSLDGDTWEYVKDSNGTDEVCLFLLDVLSKEVSETNLRGDIGLET